MMPIDRCALPKTQSLPFPIMSVIDVRTYNVRLTNTLSAMTLHLWFGIALIVTLGIRFLSFRYIYGLRRFNGPLLASFTDAWRFLYHVRKQGVPFRDLHDHYGDIVRVGPNVLSFRDPQAVRDIFGAGLNWGKVRSSQ